MLSGIMFIGVEEANTETYPKHRIIWGYKEDKWQNGWKYTAD